MKKKTKYLLVLFFSALLMMSSDCKKSKPITICGSRCPSNTPWKVESLDLNNPCFATQQECEQWAETHGYSGKPCVKCD